LQEHQRSSEFERTILPHLGAAYNLAHWLTKNDPDALDIVQEASLRAFKFFGSMRGENSRAWFLTIVRNTFYTWREQRKMNDAVTSFDDELHSIESDSPNPESILLTKLNSEMLRAALEKLPVEFREVIVLRELEGFSYKEISAMANIPIGTVMSRLARARTQLQEQLTGTKDKEH